MGRTIPNGLRRTSRACHITGRYPRHIRKWFLLHPLDFETHPRTARARTRVDGRRLGRGGTVKTAWRRRGSSSAVRPARPKVEAYRNRNITFFCVEKSTVTSYRGRNGVQQSGCRVSAGDRTHGGTPQGPSGTESRVRCRAFQETGSHRQSCPGFAAVA